MLRLLSILAAATLLAPALPAQDDGCRGSKAAGGGDCGACSAVPGEQDCGEGKRSATLDREAALKLARAVRGHVCATISRTELRNELAFVRDDAGAEALAARVREAQDEETAAAELVAAARAAETRAAGRGSRDEIDAAAALAAAERIRAPGCASGGRNLVFYEFDVITELAEAERIAAAVREAPDAEIGAALLRRALAEAGRARAFAPRSFPKRLSETGWFAALERREMAPGFVPYEINVPLWSDGAEKARFFRLPEGESIGFDAEGAWTFPVGTVFLQTLSFAEAGESVHVETRAIVREAEGLSFAAWVWNEEETDAELVEDGDRFHVLYGNSSQLWRTEALKDCNRCHNDAAGEILGLTTRQAHRSLASGESQLRAWEKRGLLRGLPTDLGALVALPSPHDESRPVAARARAYLDVHCATCHRPGGPGSGTLDLRHDTPFAETGILRSAIHETRRGVAVPGRPKMSRLWRRMASVDWDRMPNLLTTVPDDAGLDLIARFIAELEAPAPRPAPARPAVSSTASGD